jgi:hypothetical protein
MSEVAEKIEEKEAESQLHENEDGKLFIRVDDPETSLEDGERAGGEPEDGQTPKEKLEPGSGGAEGDGKTGNKAGESFVYEGDDIPASYRGKTASQVMKMHMEASGELVKKGQQLTTLEKQVEESNLSPEQIRQRLGSKDLKQLYDEGRKELAGINQDLDPEAYATQEEMNDSLRTDYLEKAQSEKIDSSMNNEANDAFKISHRSVLDDQGFELEDAQYDEVMTLAKGYAKNGRLDPDAVHHALVDALGFEAVTKAVSLKAEGKTRTDIKNAQGKTQPITNVGGSGKSGSLIDVEELVKDEEKFNAVIDKLSPADSKKLRKRIEALMDAR